MISDQPLLEKEIRFFQIVPPKKQQIKKSSIKALEFVNPEERKLHQIIRQVLKDYQYFLAYRKEEINLIEGQRVLRMNGIKVIKENGTYFIEKYVSKQDNILKRRPLQTSAQQRPQTIRVQYQRSQTITDPKYMLTMLGYTTKEKEYFQYMNLQCYKCPAYGIEIVIYENWGDKHYLMIESVIDWEGMNFVSGLLVEKLNEFLVEESYHEIDPYTLRPKGLKHGKKAEI